MTTKKTLTALAVSLIIPMTAYLPASADAPQHTHYLHAISDLRYARALLQRPDETNVVAIDNIAIKHIDRALGEIKRAAIDDGKDLADHPPIDVHLARRDRFDKALELLSKADKDLNYDEDDHNALGWREHAEKNVKDAIAYTHRAIKTDRFDDAQEEDTH